MRWPWVSRRAFDVVEQQLELERERTDKLLEMLLRLKNKGHELAHPTRVSAPPDPEAKALERAEDQFRQKLQQRRAAADVEFEESALTDLMGRGLSRDQAIAEAKRLRSEITDMQPAGG